MSLGLRKREKIPQGVRRIVTQRIDRALTIMGNGAAHPADDAIHDVRKRFKEIRGVLRLVRKELGEKTFDRENRTFRDAARPLSSVRDAKVLIDSLDKLIDHFDGRIKKSHFASLRRELLKRRREARKKSPGHDIAKVLHAARGRLKDWPLERDGWKAIEQGLHKVYSQGRRIMKKTRTDPSDESFHEWRKRAKDLRYQLEMLAPIRRAEIRPLVKQAHDLTDLLGDDHDLAVLAGINRKQRSNEEVNVLICDRRAALQKEAHEIGEKLYARAPREFVRDMQKYWKRA